MKGRIMGKRRFYLTENDFRLINMFLMETGIGNLREKEDVLTYEELRDALWKAVGIAIFFMTRDSSGREILFKKRKEIEEFVKEFSLLKTARVPYEEKTLAGQAEYLLFKCGLIGREEFLERLEVRRREEREEKKERESKEEEVVEAVQGREREEGKEDKNEVDRGMGREKSREESEGDILGNLEELEEGRDEGMGEDFAKEGIKRVFIEREEPVEDKREVLENLEEEGVEEIPEEELVRSIRSVVRNELG